MATEIALQTHAENIRSLMIQWSGNALEIGLELKTAREAFTKTGEHHERVGWKQWLKREFKMDESWAGKLIRVADRFGHLRGKRLPSGKVLQDLSRKLTPPGAVREVMRRVARGEHVGPKRARAITRKHQTKDAPTPAKANKQAQQTGKPVLASDGYFYFGATKESAAAADQRRSVVFGVRRAVKCLATMEMTATEFLHYAQPHQLWDHDEEDQIKTAARWLDHLVSAWQVQGGRFAGDTASEKTCQ